MALNIGMKEARLRLRDKKCLSCAQPQTNTELNSCSDPKCVKELRAIHQWATRVAGLIEDPRSTTYIGYSA